MAKQEVTSARVAKIAGRILAALKDVNRKHKYVYDLCDCKPSHLHVGMAAIGSVRLLIEDIKTLAASALTQSPDRKPEPKKRKKAR